MNTKIVFPGKQTYPAFSNLFENLWKSDFPSVLAKGWEGNTQSPAVNIIEGKENFIIQLAAPGLTKEDFKIKLEENLLTISCEKENKQEINEGTYTRKEFSYHSFSRSFSLPETVNTEKIGAEYKDGIVMITLPKKEEAKVASTREIQVG